MEEEAKSTAGSEAMSMVTGGAGPCTVDGTIFLRVRTCGACGIKNTDLNEITGPSSMANQKFTVWNRGTSTDPRTSHDKICHLTFLHGGFAEEQLPDQPAKADFDAFCNVMRKNAEKAAEFQGARKEMLAILCKGQVRFREGKSANKASQALQLARESQMKEFRSSQREIVTPFRAVDRQKYEEQFPGEIEAKKLKTTMKMIEGKKREVVLVRKNPDGEWDLNLRTTTGVVQEERVDHGDEQIREGQMAAKYESSHKRLFSSLTDHANTLEAASASAASQAVEQEAMEEDQSDGEEILPGGLLDMQLDLLGEAKGSASAAVKSRGGPAAPKPHSTGGQTRPAKPEPTVMEKKAVAEALPAAGKAVVIKAPAANKNANSLGRPSKFRGKSSQEALDAHGQQDVVQSLDLASPGIECGNKMSQAG